MRIIASSVIMLISAGIIISACGGSRKALRSESPEVMYNTALKDMEGYRFLGIIPYHNYEYAIELFQEVMDRFPNTKYALLAEIGIADVNFRRGDYDEAQSRYRDFYTLHPGNELAPYALYQSGLSYTKLASSYDRDLTPVKNAIHEFNKLVQNYPGHELVNDASEHLRKLREIVAKREFYTGRFYYRRKYYQSAINRLSRLVEEYPEFSNREEALYYLYMSFLNVNENNNAIKYYRMLLDEFPETKYEGDFPEHGKASLVPDASLP